MLKQGHAKLPALDRRCGGVSNTLSVDVYTARVLSLDRHARSLVIRFEAKPV